MKQATDRIKLQGEKGPVEAGSVDTRNGGGGGATTKEGDNVVKPLPSSQKPTQAPYKKGDSPVKVSYLYLPSIEFTRCELTVSTAHQPLHDIMDLSKVTDLTSSALSQLWTTYHQAKGFLSAAIPTETYLKMISNARKYPLFVVPLQRDVVGEAPDGTQTEQAVEMHVLVSHPSETETLSFARMLIRPKRNRCKELGTFTTSFKRN